MSKRKKKRDPWIEHDQANVMADYRGSRAIRSREDEGALHLFFSPFRVPTGLTDEEALVCIAFSPVKQAWEKRAIKRLQEKLMPSMPDDLPYPKEYIAGAMAISYSRARIPDELVVSRMTRGKFRAGIRKLIRLMLDS
ncbi:MAG: hypothetical protein KGI79_03235 [Patescibacteria group bacterium]|nr:hypothetical protein [Patescibacteria group bacterium]MDE2116863.1 hypothetical protein [Patescibacteria group bacterium]